MSKTEHPEEVQRAVEQLSDQYDTPEEELVEEYEQYLGEEKDKGVSQPARRALRRLSLSQKGGQMSSSEKLRGMVLGASGPINTSRTQIRNAKNTLEKYGVEEALKRGVVRKPPSGSVPEGTASVTISKKDDPDQKVDLAILDTNSNSPTHGEPIPEEDYIRVVHGVVWRGPNDGPHLFSAVVSGDNPDDIPEVPPKFEMLVIDASWAGDNGRDNTVRLNGFGVEGTTDEGPDAMDLFEDELDVVSLAEADSENYSRDDLVVTSGSVTYMELSPDEGQSRRLSIVDPFDFSNDLSRTVWLPDHTEVNFAEDSDVYVIGNVSQSQNDYPDSIEAVGVFPDPEFVVERDHIDSMADDGGPDESGTVAVSPDIPESNGHDDEPEPDIDPKEAGAELADPSELEDDHDAEFETGQTIEDSEQAEKAEDGEHLPPIIKEADYQDLQPIAGDTEDVPGSGISEDEMRDQLVGSLGAEQLADRLAGDASDAAADGGGSTGADDEAEREVSESEAEAVTSEDQGDFEPTDEDDDWEW